MTQEQIKNEYAVKFSFESWDDLIKNLINNFEINNLKFHIDSVMKIYAMECLKIADKQLLRERGGWDDRTFGITNENNIIK